MRASFLVFLMFGCGGLAAVQGQGTDDAYLTWNPQQVESAGRRMRAEGRVGGFFDLRVVHTERSYNYKLRATWMTPEVIRASARLQQLRSRLSDEQTRALVTEAESAGDTIVMIEIDPREGSGVIPLEWFAFLRPKGKTGKEVQGTVMSQLRSLKGLSGVMPRDYNYDVFWAVFPLKTESGEPLFSPADTDAEVVVSIYNKQGSVDWTFPPESASVCVTYPLTDPAPFTFQRLASQAPARQQAAVGRIRVSSRDSSPSVGPLTETAVTLASHDAEFVVPGLDPLFGG